MKKLKSLNIALAIIFMATILNGCCSKNVSKTTEPITLNIIDVSGSMQLVGDAIEKIMPTYSNSFPDLESNYSPAAKDTYDLANGYALTYVFSPSGPMFTYNPDTVQNVPKTPDELLAFAKANPGKFTYARPAASGPGRTFLQGLPYILGEQNPKDPKTWDKTWAYIKELDQYIDYYPAKTGTTFTELNQGKIKPAIRQSYEDAIKTFPSSTQLDTTNFMEALNMWDQSFGTKVKR